MAIRSPAQTIIRAPLTHTGVVRGGPDRPAKHAQLTLKDLGTARELMVGGAARYCPRHVIDARFEPFVS